MGLYFGIVNAPHWKLGIILLCTIVISANWCNVAEKMSSELSTVGESLGFRVKNRVPKDTVIRNACTVSKTHPIAWAPIGCYCTVAECSCNRVANLEPDSTFPRLYEPLECFLKKIWKFKTNSKKLLIQFWKQIFASKDSFANLYVWLSVWCKFRQDTTARTMFDYFQTRTFVRTPEGPSSIDQCKPSKLPLF